MPTSSNSELNTQYLRFDAFSIRDAIRQKLSEDEYFTDYLYPGSNLSIIIDLVSVMYQALMYNLNSAASESMFADTQVYENINRLVKLLNYNPRGYSTASIDVNLRVPQGAGGVLYPFTFIDTGLKDSNSKPVYYSLISEVQVPDNLDADGNETNRVIVQMYNGKWKLYNQVLVATGSEFETFVLSNMQSDSSQNKYVAYPHVVVYAKHTDDNAITWEKYTRVENLYSNDSSIYTATDKIFELRLNESKQYEIKFGDGIHGQKLSVNDELYVFYLDSNGPDGEINPGDISNRQLVFNAAQLGISQDIFNGIFGENLATLASLSQIRAYNVNASSVPSAEETVDDIRENAPDQFVTGGRLVTAKDVEGWVTRNYSSTIHDCVAMNNWKYITEFYAWLYNIGMSVYGDGSKYITPTILKKYDLAYTDAADCNTIYVWAKTYSNADIPSSIVTDMDKIKPLTCNVTIMPCLSVNFAICVADIDYVKANYFKDGTNLFDQYFENYVEVTVEDDLRYSPILIKNTVKNTIRSFFAETNFKIGQLVDINELYNNIMSIPGITRVRTVFMPSEGVNLNPVAKTGLCFATWTPDVITPGDDLDISSIQRKLESFQFPTLANADLDSVIKVITKNSNFSTSF